MILKNKTLDERCLEIYEEDVMSGNEILIITVYCTKVDGGVWQFPCPQIWNAVIYNKYREKYDAQILAFRNDCESITGEKGSIILNQINDLSGDNVIMMNAIDELCQMLLENNSPETVV